MTLILLFLLLRVFSYKMANAQVPQIKVDSGTMDDHIKMEDVDSASPSAASDTYMDDADLDDPELDFKQAYQNIWLSKLPKHLWETLAKIDDNDEIEIGTIRVEGSLDRPERVSLRLNEIASLFKATEKEYILRTPDITAQRNQRPGRVMMFSEKNRPGYKQRSNVWDVVDDDGNPGQGRSQLYEQFQKDEKRKENKGKPWQYRPRKPIPKITALAGTISQEFEALPVDNAEHKRFEEQRTQNLFRPKDRDAIKIGKVEAKTQYASIISHNERQAITAVSAHRITLRNTLMNFRLQLSSGTSSKRIEQPDGQRMSLSKNYFRGFVSIASGVCVI